ncbi:hypothetical protein HH310_22500 [Actinoplanes sp. TBRC 11911]|uniref:nucleotide disphospho-sugar-binding domain-containing protein n=1 Tax=Actinoplanes sp. TBRC 11911 TaxID=2729386 RepID=UPI00145F07E3|nr:nucleotide disphospho-sugar-binding domain-containing protein [Actinoplanes sp. TBRC 11911]NMO53939.1 hypothetical protein [Actinoplanes sp. TBRC 11911]
MSNVIIAGLPELTNMTPLLAISREISARGHEVFVYTGVRFEDAVRAGGAHFRAFPREVDFDEWDLDRHVQESAMFPIGPARFAFNIKAGLIHPIPHLLRGLQSLLDDFPADVILSEQTFLPPLALALGVPAGQRPVLVTLGISTPLFHSEDTAPPGSALPPMPGSAGKIRHRAMNAAVEHFLTEVQTSAEQTFASLGVKLDEFLWDATLHHSDHYLQLTVPGFEYPRSDTPAHFRYIGPVLPDADPGNKEWRGKRPIVAVMQDQQADDAEDFLVPALRGLDSLDVLAVVARRNNGGVEVTPGDLRPAAFAPVEQLLSSADVLVSDGSYDNAHLALRHGVPMVVVSGSEQEAEIAARVEWSGTGVRLPTGIPMPIDIRTAVQKVLDDPRFRARADNLRQQVNRFRPYEVIAEIVAASRRR